MIKYKEDSLFEKLYKERFNDVALEYELWEIEVEREYREMQKEMKQQGYNLN